MPRFRTIRLPRPSEYGTARAVSIQRCPDHHELYHALTRPLFITTDLGEPIMVYKIGQLICDLCLQKKCREMQLQVHLS